MTWLEITTGWFQPIRLICLRLLFIVEELSGAVHWMERLAQPDSPGTYAPTLMLGLKPSTRKIYCKALAPFVHFLAVHDADPQCPRELDRWVVRWWKVDEHRHPGTLERLVASMERVLPQLKSRMPYTRAHLARARMRHPTNHTRPMPLALLIVIALQLHGMGYPRVAGVLLLQWAFGLRPGEALSSIVDDLVVPRRGARDTVPVIMLGRRSHGTKAGRPQFALGDLALTPWLDIVLRRFLAATGRHAQLSAVATVNEYGRLLAKACRQLAIDPVFSPHSPRAGWATYCRHHGIAFQEILERGRWTNPASLRGYIDIVGSMHTPIPSRYEEIATWMLGDFEARFPTW